MLLNEIVTKSDLEKLKHELLTEIKGMIGNSKPIKTLLKTRDVKKLLQCSDSTLSYYRQSGQLPFSKVAGTYYYTQEAINQLLKNSIRD